MERIRVLVVDDSALVRRVVTEELSTFPDLEVAGTAANGRIALAKMPQLSPHLVVLDIEMPEMDGLTTLRHLHCNYPDTPVVMFSSLTELGAAAMMEALSLGAADFFAKPGGPGGLEASRRVLREQLVPSIRALAPVNRCLATATIAPTTPPRVRGASGATRVDVLAIGASTGGPNALAELFSGLPSELPVPVLVVQHMPPMFTRLLAERLTKISAIHTIEAPPVTTLSPGVACVAPGDYHLVVEREHDQVRARTHQGHPENSCRPAVDPLLRSVAAAFGPHCLAVILTGMGQDGLRGCEAIRASGGQILVQDEASSVVWGMPGFVARAGLADQVLPLPQLAGEIVRRLRRGRG